MEWRTGVIAIDLHLQRCATNRDVYIGEVKCHETPVFLVGEMLPDGNGVRPVRVIAVGDELEYADEITLGRSIAQRIPYEQSLNNS